MLLTLELPSPSSLVQVSETDACCLSAPSRINMVGSCKAQVVPVTRKTDEKAAKRERAEDALNNNNNTEDAKKEANDKESASKRAKLSLSDTEVPPVTLNITRKPPKVQKTANITPQAQCITERDVLPKLYKAGAGAFTIVSWNVNGLRGLLRNHPKALINLVTNYKVDVLALQETKLQESHVKLDEFKYLLHEQGYQARYHCSTAKKGYAGTAVFYKRNKSSTGASSSSSQHRKGSIASFFAKKQTAPTSTPKTPSSTHSQQLEPLQVSHQMGISAHDTEGRLQTLEFPDFLLTNLYVPNAGQKLERLDYRTQQWDVDLLHYLVQKQRDTKKPIIWLGDLNVAHAPKDVWNDGAKHLGKQAGTTQQEKESFQRQLNEGDFVDAFRTLHPEAQGQYSYWSLRAGNRDTNKGLRLDYFICSRSLFEDTDSSKVVVRDSYMLDQEPGSDHCPIVLELEIKKSPAR